ncbi:MAG: type VI secretion system tip protein VgrG [Polyangiaceae bacterium]|nr:type VI secretion system tip protein VgrG [Polyangiaceae bacterium]
MSTTTATTTRGPGSASRVDLSLGCGEALRVHRFAVREELSAPFGVRVLARSPDPTLALGSVLGQPTALRIAHAERSWSGICHRVRLVQSVELGAAEAGLSTYEIEIVPRLWLLGERTRYRIFQHLAIPDVVRAVLGEWDIEAESRIDAAQHPRLVYKVQYGESDLSFVSRLLEEAGIAYGVDDDGGETSRLVLSDAIHRSAPRRAHALVHVESPNERVQRDFATCVSIDGRVRPEAVSFRDHDFRRPAWNLLGASRAPTEERAALERWLYRPGAVLVEGAAARAELHDDRYGAQLAARALEAERADCCVVSFKTSAADLRPGTIVTVEGHPRPELDPRVGLLVTSIAIDGAPQGDWTVRVTAVPASTPWRPARRTPKPTVHGVETATVIGPPGEEIHTDEHGRVRVQFPWDREAQGSCWLRVAQGWAGAGLGLFALPRVGQEVMVGFLSGDPDQPIVVGRVSNALNPAPLKLPAERSQSVWRSGTTPGGEGWSEIRIEDMKGAELLSIRAERDMAIVALIWKGSAGPEGEHHDVERDERSG